MTFGEEIRRLREESGYSLRKFAELCKISPTYLSKIERGEFKPPSEKVINRMAFHLDKNEKRLCCLAGKVPQEWIDWIIEKPVERAKMIREAHKKYESRNNHRGS